MGISRLANESLASQEGLCFMEQFNKRCDMRHTKYSVLTKCIQIYR